MANFDIRMDLQGDILQTMKKVTSQMSHLQKNTKNFGKSWQTVSKGIIGASLVRRVTSSFGDVMRVFDDTQKTFQAFSDTSGEVLSQFRKDIIKTSITTGASMGDVNQILSSVATRTGDIHFATGIIKSLSELQVASGATGEDLGNVASMFKNLGVSAAEGSKYMNIMYSVGKHGSFTLKEMAKYGAKAFSAMKQYNGQLDATKIRDFTVAAQLLQVVTGDSAESSTALYQAYNRIRMKPAQEMMRKYGVSMKDASGNARNLMDVMIDLRDKGLSLDEAKSAFGERGMKVFTAASDKSLIKLKEQLEAMKQYNDLHKDAKANTRTFTASLNRLSAAFTGAVLPALTPVVSALATLTAHLNPAIITGFAAGLLTLVGVIKVWRLWQDRAIIAQAVLDALSPPMGWAALGLAAVVGGGAYAYLNHKAGNKTTAPSSRDTHVHVQNNVNVDKSGNVKQSTKVKRKTGFSGGMGGSIFSTS